MEAYLLGKARPRKPLGRGPVKPREPNTIFQSFAVAFDREMSPARYDRTQVKDFVHLSKLLKLYGAEPPDYKVAIVNYFHSPMSKRTFADFCTRYADFVKGWIDKYGKPVTKDLPRHMLLGSRAEPEPCIGHHCTLCEVAHNWPCPTPDNCGLSRNVACPKGYAEYMERRKAAEGRHEKQ